MSIALMMGHSLAFILIAACGLLIRRVTRIDITLSCLLSGVLGGLIISQSGLDIGLRAEHVEALVFYIFLPVLIFDAAWHLDPVLLRRWFLPALVYATLGVIITALLTMIITFFLMASPQEFPWLAALLTGAILAATDPVAVVAKLSQLNAPKDLLTLFEGESLLNDATAVVLFTIVLMFATSELSNSSISEHLVFFAKVFLGGILVGVLIGGLCQFIITWLCDAKATMVILIMTAFGSFYIAEHLFHVSGIMAVASAALSTRLWLDKFQQQEPNLKLLSSIPTSLNWLGLLFNMLIFALMGLVITFEMFIERWLAMLIGIAAALIARFASVYLSSLALSVTTQAVPKSWRLLLSWGGLRGAIAIALVLSLPTSLPYWWTIQSIVFGVVLFNLVVQGTTFAALLRKQLP